MFSASHISRRFFSQSTALRQYPFLKTLGLAESNPGVYRAGEWVEGRGALMKSTNPHDNETIATTSMGSAADYNDCVAAMQEEKKRWMNLPMPERGEIVR